MKLKSIVSFIVIILALSCMHQITYASNDEQEVLSTLTNNVSVKTYDGLFDKNIGLGTNEGAINIVIRSQADLELFKSLSASGKKKLLNNLTQSNWGDYLGVKYCFASIIYNNKLYATSKITYDVSVSNILLQYFEQGTDNIYPWKMNSSKEGSVNQESKDSVKKNEPVKIVTLKDTGVIIKNNSMVPAAAVFKSLNGSIQIDNKSKNITLKFNNTKISGKLNSKYVKINGVGSSYTVAPQIIEGKLMVPVQLIKDLFKAKVSVNKGSNNFEDYIESVTVTTLTAKVTVPINDIYEKYQMYIGKTVWVHTPQLIIEDQNGNYVSKIKNLSSVKITSIKREPDIGYWLNVNFIYKGRTYIASLKEYNFPFSFYTVSPYKKYNFSQNNWRKIENSQISIGMNSDMVYLSWGIYDRHSEDYYSWGSTDMWVYENSYSNDKYLYFTNDILQSISSY
ncbi:copper amine oxidase N-terminal domain-containing protein [Paenibacillus gallinarum]|uniref:Copper amine oxidase N-terminal domain-containing protein n=1 Tax=Paenibacillus gallinarum TaxID=2762232 RepID=A0ABR8SVS7_9BACL|nr:copper amine oxidase N-terminal domain-containing protein [Paenibacillus gallinarum]MBD7967199.1 copper amine oxidase N-terminal domain-containing protein [Paenibacillus gallinarum]